MAARKDLYKILGVSKTAKQDEIKRAYRKLALKYHPDKTKGDKSAEDKFKDISNAHTILSDPEKRKQYDMMSEGFDPYAGGFKSYRYAGGERGGQAEFSFDDRGGFGSFSDIFDSIFGRTEARGRTARPASQAGEDVVASISVPFETAVRGGYQQISVTKDEVCPNCRGSGAQPGSRVETCPECGGSGTILYSHGSFGLSRVCPTCLGTGKKIVTPCVVCRGSGRVKKSKNLRVKIPAGIKDGQTIRLGGEGEPGINGGPNGDLLLNVSVEAHPDFSRQNDSINSETVINLEQAVMGGTVRVRTLDGTATLRIPPGTQPGTKFRLRGRGIRKSDGTRGDHYVTVKVRTPRNLTEKQKELFKQFAKETNLPS
jgi:molecular chaperone DnaJ